MKGLRLLAVLAHPDDESLGMGGALAKYADEGVGTYLVTATRGERGRFGAEGKNAPPQVVGEVREVELRCAAEKLGLREVSFLDYVDGDLDQADPAEAISRIVSQIRRIRPQVVVTFGPEGGYGHPDHIAISQLTAASLVCAADQDFAAAGEPHRVQKLYYMAWPPSKWQIYQAAFRRLVSKVDGVDREASPWPEWALTTVINTRKYVAQVWRAIQCHKTQISIYSQLGELSESQHEELWGSQEFYRVFSSVNSGRRREEDLFEGLRQG